jgi:hypothetical protein
MDKDVAIKKTERTMGNPAVMNTTGTRNITN